MTVGPRADPAAAGRGGARAAPLPASRWRAAGPVAPRGAPDRVRRAHAQARATLRLALAFIAAALPAAALGPGRWLPLHLFLAGGVVLAISGVSLMLTVTWAAAPAPPGWAVTLQRGCVAAGAAGVAAGRELGPGPAVLAAAGTAYVVGLIVLAVLLGATARRGVERRFDAAVAAYLAALAAGAVGAGLGAALAAGALPHGVRDAHVTLNLLGLVGLVVGGTLPFFAATVGRSRMAPHATGTRLGLAVAWQALALTVAVAGLAAGATAVATGGLGGYAAGIGGSLWLLPRPTRRGLRWAGPRLLALWAGAAWWMAAVVATAVEVSTGGGAVLTGRWLGVLVVAGYGQILWGSLAYLLPVLRGGGHHRLGHGFAVTRSWTGLAAANLAGLALAVSSPRLAAVALATWLVDAGVRAARVGLGGRAGPATRPEAESG